jgi:hypothetical protein
MLHVPWGQKAKRGQPFILLISVIIIGPHQSFMDDPPGEVYAFNNVTGR